MNNYYTLRHLVEEVNAKITDHRFDFAITPFKNVLEIYLSGSDSDYRLILSTDPSHTAFFLDEYRPPKKSNTLEFFNVLKGERVEDTNLVESDRFVTVTFTSGHKLLFKLFGNAPNAYLIDDEWTIQELFKDGHFQVGERAPEPKSPPDTREISKEMKPRNQLLRLNPQFPRAIISHIVSEHNIEGMSIEEVKQFVDRLTQQLLRRPTPRVLTTGDLCLWNHEFVSLEDEKSFESVNAAVTYAYREAMYLRQLHRERGELLTFMKQQQERLKTLRRQLEQSDKSLERADEYERLGHILMAYAHEPPPTADTIKRDDIYEPGNQITIEVESGASMAENAQNYYEKAEDARRSYKESKRRLKVTRQNLETLEQKIAELEELTYLKKIRKWKKENLEYLKELGYGRKEQTERLPFKSYQMDSYNLWVGKNARSNDELLQAAHKEDIWLHARGVGGSHAVIRMNNSKEFPPKQYILKAASIAAFFSKARGNNVAPVMYTKAKYVRKPKGGAPGAVFVEREQVEMVSPHSPEEVLNKATNE